MAQINRINKTIKIWRHDRRNSISRHVVVSMLDARVHLLVGRGQYFSRQFSTTIMASFAKMSPVPATSTLWASSAGRTDDSRTRNRNY